MRQRKPLRGWMVKDTKSFGHGFWYSSFGTTRRQAKQNFMDVEDLHADEWKTFAASGFTVVRVTITEDKPCR